MKYFSHKNLSLQSVNMVLTNAVLNTIVKPIKCNL